ncbi:MAG: recombinase family protein, partial [Mycobacterium sp.]
GRIVYICKHCHGISILADNVEPLVIELVGRRLAAPDAVGLLKAEIHDVAEAERLRAEKTALFAELDAFALERAEGLMTARQVQIASEAVQRKIKVIEHLEEDAERVRVFTGIPLGSPEAGAAVQALSADRFRAVLDTVATVTIAPVGKVGHVFHKDRVKVEWKA